MKQQRNNRIQGLIIGIVALVSLISIAISAMVLMKEKRTGYVDTIRLFREYNLKKELESREAGRLNGIRRQIDSFQTLYRIMQTQKADTGDKKLVEYRLMQLSELFDREYEASSKEINETVWKRLNPAIDAFARQKNLELLIGANGMGTVLYGADSRDFTDELIRYINREYEGKN